MCSHSAALTGAALVIAAGTLLSCAPPKDAKASDPKVFIDTAEDELLRLTVDASRAEWVKSTYITDDTEIIAAQADERQIAAGVRYAKQAAAFKDAKLDEVYGRKLNLLRNSLTLAAPSDPALSAEVTKIASSLEGTYGKGKYCPPPVQTGIGAGKSNCLSLGDLEKILANSRDAKQLKEAWIGWHEISKPMRSPYARFVGLSNQGAKELGFTDTGAMWRGKYDMPPDEFAKELDRLWEQVKPLYVSLHTYVRNRLREKYGDAAVPSTGPIPAHLLGNMWAQGWGNIYPLVAPKNADPGYDLTKILKARKTGEKDMVRYGEKFFMSLGFESLPKTFWDRSLFAKPADHDVVCHASAWDIDLVNDLRIKMCVEPTEEDFTTVHHELGHNFYQRAYNKQSFLFRDSANDGFHEAIGDTIALSVTPEYLVKAGLLNSAPNASKDIGLLLNRALDKVAFLPFGLVIDQWRWKVFSGEIPPEKYNAAWWELKRKYQGVVPPVDRSEDYFDPGAKYHVASNTPYARYFIAHIVQFQFHKALSKIAGCKDPIHRCSIYQNQEAGRRLNEMLEMGMSRPWQDAMQKLTGERKMDASAMLEYFAPLKQWLDEQNKGKPTGW